MYVVSVTVWVKPEFVANWMAQPRQGLKHRAIFFGDQEVAA
jgi:hypothetical protein